MVGMENGHVPSPCVGICELDAEKVCVGCGRSIAEIARWGTMTDRERQAVLDRLKERRGKAAD